MCQAPNQEHLLAVSHTDRKGKCMKSKDSLESDDMRPEYDFDYSKTIRGKYYDRLMKEGSNVIVLEPDIARVFRDSASVNKALRSLLKESSVPQD